MLHNFAGVSQQVVVKELFFHFALQEGLDCLLEVRRVSFENKEVQLMAVEVREVSVFFIGSDSVPLLDEVKSTKFSVVSSLYFSDLA